MRRRLLATTSTSATQAENSPHHPLEKNPPRGLLAILPVAALQLPSSPLRKAVTSRPVEKRGLALSHRAEFPKC
jgi:hypothetical protein